MAAQWIRRAKTCLRPDGAAAGVTLAVMRRHLSSGDAVPVRMLEYRELERVASFWELWEVRLLANKRVAKYLMHGCLSHVVSPKQATS